MTLKVPVLSVDEWRQRFPRRQFLLPDLPADVLRRLAEGVGREVRDALEGVDEIISQVREGGDAAVQRLTMTFDGTATDPLELSPGDWRAAAAANTVSPFQLSSAATSAARSATRTSARRCLTAWKAPIG